MKDTKLLTIGTIHQFHANTNYTYEDILKVIKTYNPDLICIEIREKDFRKVPYLNEMMIAATYGKINNIPVVPIDDWEEENNPRILQQKLAQEERYKVKLKEEEKLLTKSEIISNFHKKYGTNYILPQNDILFYNGDEYSNYNREKYKISIQIFGDSPFNLNYLSRNGRMVELTENAITKYKATKALIFVGCEHKSFFDDIFSTKTHINLLQVKNILPLSKINYKEFCKNDTPENYFDFKYGSKDVEKFYMSKIIPLIHAPNMDFFPDTIPRENIEKAKPIIETWCNLNPNSPALIYESAWIAFLDRDFEKSLKYLNEYTNYLEKKDIDVLFGQESVLRLIGMIEDLKGNRKAALKYYNSSIAILEKKGADKKFIDFLFKKLLLNSFKFPQRGEK